MTTVISTRAGQRLLGAMNREGWVGPIENDASIEDAISAIEAEAAEQEHRRLARLGAERSTPEKQAASLRKYNPAIVAAIEAEVRDEVAAKVAALPVSDRTPTQYRLGFNDARNALLAAISSSSATETQDGERPEEALLRLVELLDDINIVWADHPDLDRAHEAARAVLGIRPWTADPPTPTPDDRDRGHRGWPTECAVEGCWLASGHEGNHAPDAVPDDRDREVARIAAVLEGEGIVEGLLPDRLYDAGLRASGGNET